MTLTRRQFGKRTAAIAGMSAIAPFSNAFASGYDQMNIFCWEGYNSDEVLWPFRSANPGATVRAESGTSDPDMINKLRRKMELVFQFAWTKKQMDILYDL